MAAFGNIRPPASNEETADAARPWMTMPKQDGGNGGFFGRNAQTQQRPLFSPMKTEDLVKLSGIMGSPGGGLMGIGRLMGAAQLSLENQRQALNDLLYPRAPGGFLPRAVQGQRTPNAPGAR
jgi:hypothetical protein